MALVKVLRNGQITLPKSLRDRPKTAVDSDLVHSRFSSMVSELREKVKDVDPQELEAVLGEAVEAAKRATAEKDQGRR